MKRFATAFAILVSGLVLPFAAFAGTPNFWKCTGKVGGAWQWGEAPYACNAASFGTDATLLARYAPEVFDQNAKQGDEQIRYMNEMHAILRDTANLYLRRREPHVDPVELAMFRRAFLATAHQETYWSHYRLDSKKKLKLMRGDSGHGHGLMQIDDRSHLTHVKAGGAWDLMDNLIYSLDMFYAEWESSASQPCVKRAQDFEARARSAYAAYNGGHGSICRWTSSKGPFASNDRGFLNKWRDRDWEHIVDQPEKAASVDVACVIEGRTTCLRANALMASGAKEEIETPMLMQASVNVEATSIFADLDGFADCWSSDSCGLDQTDSRAASFDFATRVSAKLEQLKTAKTAMSFSNEIASNALDWMSFGDDQIREAALHVLTSQPARADQIETLIENLKSSGSPEVLLAALPVLKRYAEAGFDRDVTSFLVETIAHGPVFSARLLAKNISPFLSQASLSLYETVLRDLPADAQVRIDLERSLATAREH